MRRQLAFLAWTVPGVAVGVGLITPLTIGPVALVVAGVLVVALMVSGSYRDGSPAGLISGSSVVLFYVAWLNRQGPGTVCTTLHGGGEQCAEEWSPWPWLAVGVALVVAGWVVRRSLRRTSAREG
ncbi:hypothetical protein acdb102_18480 [Acidothermaceae bacterium B102]|nr:hypothetical protein acdb102_18480 [Acidothermaceae bacterium B102]